MKRIYFFFTIGLFITAACSADHNDNSREHALLAGPASRQFLQLTEAPSWDERDISDLRRAVEQSAEHGLNPTDYHQAALASETLAEKNRQLLATDAYLTLAQHLRDGKVDPEKFQAKWKVASAAEELSAELQSALEDNRVEASLNRLAPQNSEYLMLKRALSQLATKPVASDWEPIPNGPDLHPNMRSKQVIPLRQRLLKEEVKGEDRTLYDESLQEALKKFQRSVNLTPDGVLGSETRARLNTSPQDKREIIRVNMERWRWLPADLGERHVRVSIADYTLQAYERGEIASTHDVVVGKVYRQTPIFSDEITHIVINPWWVVPHTLAVKDLLPKFQEDPSIIQEKHYEIRNQAEEIVDPDDIDWNVFSEDDFPFEVRQQPGSENALGRVKFIFPNKFDVYLHDTPSQHLFDKTQRDFSSGCIRVEHPFALARWILDGEQGWTMQQLEAAVNDGKKLTITPETPVPVHLMYWTAVVKGDSLHFPADVYDRDQKVLTALNTPPPDK